MAIVLVAVLVMAASIWIAIRMEPHLGRPTAQAPLAGGSHNARPAHCRFRPGAANAAVNRPVRCTQPGLVHGAHRLSWLGRELADLREQDKLFRPVGDPQQQAVSRALQHRPEHGVGRGCVEVPRGFFEKQDGMVGQDGPGHTEALQLAARDRMTRGREHGVETTLEPLQPRTGLEMPEEVRYLPVWRAARADAQVRA